MTTLEQLSATDTVSEDFTLKLSAAQVVSLSVGDAHADLNERGTLLISALLGADQAQLLKVEALLTPGKHKEWVTPQQAAEILGVSRPTVVRWAAGGELTDQRVGTHHRYARAEVEALRKRRAVEAAGNRAAAQRARALAEVDGRLDEPPTPAELVEAGSALRDGDRDAAEAVFARARRADALRSAEAAASASSR